MYKHNYTLWEKGIPTHICDQIIKYGELQKLEGAKVGSNQHAPPRKEIRDSLIKFIKPQWILDWIIEPMLQANQSIYNFNLSNLEEIQFTKYGPNQFYSWHIDLNENANEVRNNDCRKLSMVVFLTDPKTYEGGELELRDVDAVPTATNKKSIITNSKFKDQGTMIIFPSYVWHRVKPVTKGTRYSLVGWWRGPLFG
jgi:PKHD-type hydroxylase